MVYHEKLVISTSCTPVLCFFSLPRLTAHPCLRLFFKGIFQTFNPFSPFIISLVMSHPTSTTRYYYTIIIILPIKASKSIPPRVISLVIHLHSSPITIVFNIYFHLYLYHVRKILRSEWELTPNMFTIHLNVVLKW